MKKRSTRTVLFVLLGLIALCGIVNIILTRMGGHFSITLPVKHTAEFSDELMTQFPGQLVANSNVLTDEQGNIVLLQGLMPADAARLREIGKFDQGFIQDISDTGANVVRIPVHPENWVHDPDYLWRYLDPLVAWAGQADMYVIIDWHYIGNVISGAGSQMPDIDEQPLDLTLEFWEQVARYFHDTPNVIFELFNEPQSIAAPEWRAGAQEIISVIRAQGAQQLVIVGGIDYGKDLSWVMDDPVQDGNVAYAAHIYPSHSSAQWDHWFGEVAERYPVLVTEWGFMDENRDTSHAYLAGDQRSYGEPFLEYLDKHSIGWVACWYDDTWMPQIFTEGWQSYTRYGEFIMQRLNTAG